MIVESGMPRGLPLRPRLWCGRKSDGDSRLAPIAETWTSAPTPASLRCLGDVAGALDMDAVHRLPNTPHRFTTARRALHRVAHAVGIGDVGFLEAELSDLGERLEEIVVARIAARDADPDSAPEQEFADVAADESGAAEDGDKLFVSLDHTGGATSPSLPTLTRQAGVS